MRCADRELEYKYRSQGIGGIADTIFLKVGRWGENVVKYVFFLRGWGLGLEKDAAFLKIWGVPGVHKYFGMREW